jgi:hypothetical protein
LTNPLHPLHPPLSTLSKLGSQQFLTLSPLTRSITDIGDQTMETPKRRKRTTQASKPQKGSSCPVPVSSSTCLILELPLEVMEMIIGNISIVDLQSFCDSSPLINVLTHLTSWTATN